MGTRTILVAVFVSAIAAVSATRSVLGVHPHPRTHHRSSAHPHVHHHRRTHEPESKLVTPRIVGGSEAGPGQFPHQASIVADSDAFCAGSILSDEWILTAAQCLVARKSFLVTVGSLKYTKGNESSAQNFTTTEKYLHPQYNEKFNDNDIALLKLPKTMHFNSLVQPVQLPSYTMALDLFESRQATVSGWGTTSDDSNILSPVLRHVKLGIVKDKVCENFYGNVMISNKLCCSTKSSQSICTGDAGSPLVIENTSSKYTQVGIASFISQSGCTKGDPVVFTRVTSFLEFISDITRIQISE